LTALRLPQRFTAKNPFSFMELANCFQRRVQAYRFAVQGGVSVGCTL